MTWLPTSESTKRWTEQSSNRKMLSSCRTRLQTNGMALEEDFAKAAYEVSGTDKTLVDAWSGDHLGFYSSLGAVNRSDDPGKRSYAATGYLRLNLGRPNLKVLTEAQATKIVLDGTTATGVEFVHGGRNFKVNAKQEVVLSTGVIQTP
jgi:choline dehydrogenase-like flavoprotein